MQKITPFLWFNDNAEDAVNFYCSIFKNAKVSNVSRANGKVMVASFDLDGQAFIALNGGPAFTFTEAVSFVVNCDTQEEIDEKWNKLSNGGAPGRCGWLKDRFGLSWQIVPPVLGQLMSDPDPARAKRVMDAMMQMDRIIIADLLKAADQQ